MNKPTVIYFAYGVLGRICLERLMKEGYAVSYVFTLRDLSELGVDTFCLDHKIEFSYQDTRKKLEYYVPFIKDSKVDFLVSINYRYIIDIGIIREAKWSLNLHGSLLPNYRGRTPHVWAIINGEEEVGVTAHLMEAGVDTGDIILQERVTVDVLDTGAMILSKYERIYPDLLIKSMLHLIKGGKLTQQDETKATYYGKRIPEMGYIDFMKDTKGILNFIRAQAEPYPGAYSYLVDGRKIVIDEAEISIVTVERRPIGRIFIHENRYFVWGSNDLFELKRFRFE